MEKDKKEMANYLWLEINKAIVNSPNVKNCLHLMAEMNMIDFLSGHDFLLDGKLLIKRILEEPNARVTNASTAQDPQLKQVDITRKLTYDADISLN